MVLTRDHALHSLPRLPAQHRWGDWGDITEHSYNSHSGCSLGTGLPRADPLCLSGAPRLWAGRPVTSTPTTPT